MDDFAYAIMYETTKLCYRVSQADVTCARNKEDSALLAKTQEGTKWQAETTKVRARDFELGKKKQKIAPLLDVSNKC